MAKKSRDKGKKGERNVGRLFLRKGYLAWRTAQNRQSKLDDESDDVSASMAPEHMRCSEDGSPNRRGDYLDPYYIDRDKYPEKGETAIPISEFEPIENLTIEVKNGYDTKTYNKQFRKWLERLREETPEGNVWALFWRRNYASKYCYRVAYENPSGIVVMTIDQEQTLAAIDELAWLASVKRVDQQTKEFKETEKEEIDKAFHVPDEALFDLCQTFES